MDYYFYQKDGIRHGPFTFKELKSKRILKSTDVWREGMDDWEKASNIEELKEIVISEPPPAKVKTNYNKTITQNSTAKKENGENEDSKLLSLTYDPTYEKEKDNVSFGLGLMLLGIFFIPLLYIIAEDYAAVYIVLFLARILLSIYIIQIAGRLNRNQVGWGIFGFFFPAFALIIIGLLKKKMIKKVDLSNYFAKGQKIEYCMRKAKQSLKNNKYTDSLIYLNKLLDIEPSYDKGRMLRGKVCFDLNLHEKAKSDFKKLTESNKYCAEAFYYLGKIDIMNYNREQAIKNWFNAKNLGYDKAKEKLDLYHNFTGVYMLNKNGRSRKLINKKTDHVIYYFRFDYISGFEEIDKLGIPNNSVIHAYDNGLKINIKIKLETKEQSVNYAIAFYEINEIKTDMNNQLILKLFDDRVIMFHLKTEHNEELLILSNLYKAATGEKIVW